MEISKSLLAFTVVFLAVWGIAELLHFLLGLADDNDSAKLADKIERNKRDGKP